MLERTLASQPEVASNLPADQLPTSWLYLLPSVRLARVAAIGHLDAPTRTALASLGAAIDDVTLPVSLDGYDLVVVGSVREPIEVSALGSRTIASLAGGVVGLAPTAWLVPAGSPAPRRIDDPVRLPATLATGLPASAHRRRPMLERARRVGRRTLARAIRRERAHPGDRVRSLALVLSPLASRETGTILRVDDDPALLPAYIRAVAVDGGHDLAAHRWTVSPQAMFASQKVVFVATAEGSVDPDVVIKVTRQPSFAPLLQREHDGLTALLGAGVETGAPRPLFYGEHAGLAVQGQTAVVGEPLVRLAAANPSCELVERAASWLVDVATRTAVPSVTSDAAGALGELVRRYVGIYQPPPSEREELARCVETIGRSSAALPAVFQHGDSGAWNVLVGRDGEVTFLDWENADPQGVPLWDLVYLTQTHASAVATRRGVRYTARSFADQLVAPSAWRAVLDERVERCARALSMDPAVVEPITSLLWVHLAVKESTRLRPDGLSRSRYRQYVRAVMGRLR